jgi:hypothetical protein
MKNSLELFSGSATVSQVCSLFGFSAWSVDSNSKLNPSICCDILDLTYDQLPFSFDFIWASPDCRYFSRAGDSTNWKKNILKYRQYFYEPLTLGALNSLNLLNTTISIIDYYKPKLWVIENPIGRMRHIPELKKFAPYRYSVNYQDWGHSFAKETDLYTNQLFCFDSKKVQRSGPGVQSVSSRFSRSVVPSLLIKFILEHAQF